MTYAALPDMRIPYDNDGTVTISGDTGAGPYFYPSGANLVLANGAGAPYQVSPAFAVSTLAGSSNTGVVWHFFPEQREVTANYTFMQPGGHGGCFFSAWKGSNDTTNGLDGTWETASTTACAAYATWFDWRKNIQTISFTGPKKVVRSEWNPCGDGGVLPAWYHLYGVKGTGQTPDDIIYLNADAADAPFTAPIDFGDMPLGTSAIKHFKVQNASATKTANTINIQCNDSDFIISTDGVTWVVTINIASLAAGAKSAQLYIRDTAPNPGGRLGPRFARIVTTVASYT